MKMEHQQDLWIVTCQLHKRDPLAENPMRCYCRVLTGEEAKTARMKHLMMKSGVRLSFSGGEFHSTTFGWVPAFSFGG